MAIVKMKRLRLLGLRSDRERLLRPLQSLGCVEFSEPAIDLSDPAWAALAKPEGTGLSKAKEQYQQLDSALDVLRKYVPTKDGLLSARPTLTEAQLFDDSVYTDGLAAAWDITNAERALAACQAEQAKLQSQKASLEPWLSLNVPLETEGDSTVSILFGAVPSKVDFAAFEAAAAQATPLAQLFPAGSDRELQYFLLVCHASVLSDCTEAMRPFGYSRVTLRGWTGTAADNIRSLDNHIAALERQAEEHRDHIASLGDKRNLLRLCADRACQEISREENKARLIDTDAAYLLEGWLPADKEPDLAKLLSGFSCAWETADPMPEEYPQVPVKLKNNLITRSMNTITEMYSLPAYDGVDPNPLMAPFFILFFGMIMADMGYGLLMIIASAVVLLKQKPKNPSFMEMIFWCGISTVLWGAASGGFFGDMIPQLVTMLNPNSTFEMPALFTPLNDIVAIMIGSLALGFIQVITGMTISVVKKSKDGQFIDALFSEISWWIVLGGLALFLCGTMVAGLPPVLATVGKVMLIAGFLMLALGGTREAKGFGKVTSFIGIIYNGVTGFFSDILSYIRLMALMVSGSVIASVFNTLGATTGIVPAFILISLLGNALNLALSLLGAYVHDLRLQCLEFFGRFYKEGGMPYQPLSIDTKYIDVIKEEN
ncbi:MAG: V-type ATP synthase subunit I [Oscillospiraceae bacterium]|jgi:V/A-type H+-transporting ATPase subunit I|nr:V-type ATP synthase subunit I [Oscillospiraceae bacterium]